MLISKLLGLRAPRSRETAWPVEFPLELEERLNHAHARAPLRDHLDTLYGGLMLGSERYPDVYFRCLKATGTAITPYSIFQRFQTRHDLLRYFFATRDVAGARVECGAYRGATALLLCHAWRSIEPAFRGKGLYLVDSFSGTAESTSADFIPVRDSTGRTRMEAFFPARRSDVTPELVRSYFTEFPDVSICNGWIPAVFDSLPEEHYAWVHVDLTLFEATLAALDYFYPRLSSGGVLACDGSLFCPGVAKAVERYALEHDVPYVMLGHRQYVFRK